MIRPTFLATLLALTCLGCSPVGEQDQSFATVAKAGSTDRSALEEAIEATPDDCLLMVWSNQKQRDITFDRAHDLVDGGAISCATGTSPSQFQAALDALGEAARSGDSRRVLAEVGIPLLYIDRAGNRVELDEARAEALAEEVFDAELMRTLERLDLKDMTVVPERGGFFELGSLWLVVDQQGGRPRLVTVNRQALAESADAARSAAQGRRGEVVPES